MMNYLIVEISILLLLSSASISLFIISIIISSKFLLVSLQLFILFFIIRDY